MFDSGALRARVARWAGAFILYDLITGLAAYCVITLVGLWLFSITWIRIAGEYAAAGRSFFTPAQLELAWLGAFIALPIAGGVIYLAIRAYSLPREISRTGGQDTFGLIRARIHPARDDSPGSDRR